MSCVREINREKHRKHARAREREREREIRERESAPAKESDGLVYLGSSVYRLPVSVNAWVVRCYLLRVDGDFILRRACEK